VKFVVVGAGATGGFLGAHLAHAGIDVTLIARGAHLAAIREKGLTLRSLVTGETHVIEPASAVETPADAPPGPDFDLIIFTVKAFDTESAAALLPPVVGPNTAVLTLQNGVDSVDLLSAAVGAEHILPGTTRINCVIGEPGVIVQNTPFSKLEMGELSGEETPRIRMIADAFRGLGIEVFVSDDPLRETWTKFIMIAPHATLTSATGQAVAAIREVPEGAALYRSLIEEVTAVGRASGVNLAPDAVERTMDFIMNLPPGAKTSMLFDYERQKRVELDYLTGTVVRRGRALGIPTPGFDALYAVLKARAIGFGGLT
jgi:2-dehydropantoate 2-reductase